MAHVKIASKLSSLLASATEDELAVSQILLDLKSLVSLSESLANFNWGCRRRRSCLDENPPSPHEHSRPTPSVRAAQKIGMGERAMSRVKAAAVVLGDRGGDAARTTVSPTTPLAFWPSESDENIKHSSIKICTKRSRDEHYDNDILERLTRNMDEIRGEVDNVKNFYNRLKAYNSELKAIKHEVMNNFPKKDESQMEIREVINHGTESTRNRINVGPHQQPYTTDPTAQPRYEYLIGPIQTRFCSSNSDTTPDPLDSLGIDLNVPVAEVIGEPLDGSMTIADRRFRSADARRTRRGLMRAQCKGVMCFKYYQRLNNYGN